MAEYTNVKKGWIKNLNTGDIKKFFLNPNSISDDTPITYVDMGGIGSYKKKMWAGADNTKLSIELFIRSRDTTVVVDFINFIEQFKPITTKRFVPPPLMLLTFGTYIKKVIVTDIKIDRTDFDSDLEVKEVTITLSLEEVH